MKSYQLPADESDRIPADARSVRMSRDTDGAKVITFVSDDGPIGTTDDDHCSCQTKGDELPNGQLRSSPLEGY